MIRGSQHGFMKGKLRVTNLPESGGGTIPWQPAVCWFYITRSAKARPGVCHQSGGMDGCHLPPLSLHGLTASSFPLHPFYSFSSFLGEEGYCFFLCPVVLLFVLPFLSHGTWVASWWLCSRLNATIRPTSPAWSALGCTLRPEGGIKHL